MWHWEVGSGLGGVWLFVGQCLVCGRFVGHWIGRWGRGQVICGSFWCQLKSSILPVDWTMVFGCGFVLGVLAKLALGIVVEEVWVGGDGILLLFNQS